MEVSYPDTYSSSAILVINRTALANFDAILDKSAVNLRDHSAAWQKSGWKTFNPASKPYGADEVLKSAGYMEACAEQY